MNRREKLIALVVGILVGGFLLYLAVDGLWLSKLNQRDARQTSLTTEINQLQANGRQLDADRATLKSLAKQTLGTDVEVVGAAVSRRLTKLLETAGLARNMKVDLQRPKPIPGGQEIECSVGAEGTLANICDLLYLLKAGPELHRIDNLTIKPRGRDNTMRVDFRYATVVLDAPKDKKVQPVTLASDPKPEGSLSDPAREDYNIVTARNLLARYEPPVERTVPPRDYASFRPSEPSEERPPDDWQYRVVALPQWGGKEEVFVRDNSSGQMQRYQVGEAMAGGKIVMVDYRSLPRPDRAGLLSQSRVILKLGRDYWAVELGQSLADRRQLRRSELPEGLAAVN